MPSLRSLLATSLLTALVVALAAASAAAAPVTYDGISADGKVALFSTRDQLVPGDTDQETDVYERTFDLTLGEYVTREVSIGPSGGNDTLPALYDGVSEDGEEVFFSTKEGMVPGDKDHREDVYVRNLISNQTFLASAGAGSGQGGEACAAQGCGSGPYDAGFPPGGVPASGGRVFFVTSEKLVAGDKDEAVDVYMRDLATATTVRVSTGDSSCAGSGCGNGAKAIQFLGTDEAGDRAFLVTSESLEAADTDANPDIYAHDLVSGATDLVSAEGDCPTGLNCNPTFGGASADGAHVFFESNEQIAAADEDSSQDVYDWTGSGAPALVSLGPDGGNGPHNATFQGSSADGEEVYFQTSEALVPADKDHVTDVYERAGGTTTLVSAGEPGRGNEELPALFSWASTDGATVVFRTSEQLSSVDTDQGADVYARSGGTTTLVSTGTEASGGDFDAAFAGASDDGLKIFFVTAESLSGQDSDDSSDIYVRSAAATQLVSTGPAGGNGEYSAGLHGVSADGARAFFVTQERLTVDDDFLEEADVYGWSSGVTLLVSVKNDATLVLGPPPPTLEATDPSSPGVSTQPRVIGQSTPGALIKIYSTSNCSKEPVAQGSADELASPGLLVVPVALGSTTEYRATAEAEGIVSVCSKPIAYKQETPAPPPVEEGGGTGGTTEGGDDGGGSVSGGTPASSPSGGSTGGSGSGGSRHGGVAYVAPLVRITFAPGAKTRQRRPTFRFDDSTGQPNTHFFCRIDRARWQACSSPLKVKRLRLGRHVFSVKAVNAVGVAGSSSVRRAFKVVAR
jgi:hypothetical protein